MSRNAHFSVWLVVPLLLGCGDISLDDPSATSSDLENDKRLMWETTAIRSGVASTHRAQAAAKRVFNTVDLTGLTHCEVVAAIGDPQSSNESMYNFPFYATAEDVMVYRFDTGSYGWQFNVHFDDEEQVTRVEHLGIE